MDFEKLKKELKLLNQWTRLMYFFILPIYKILSEMSVLSIQEIE